MVHSKGLEPPPLSGLDPKSSASANFATSANMVLCEGLEPTTQWLRVTCSTNWANKADSAS